MRKRSARWSSSRSSRLGYKVAQAESALEGVEIYRQKLEAGERFDRVILDLTLPGGMGGKEALKKLIEIDPTVNAIVSSGYAMDATMSRYQDFGFRGVIAKPYEAAELGKIVHEVIASSQLNLRAGLSRCRTPADRSRNSASADGTPACATQRATLVFTP